MSSATKWTERCLWAIGVLALSAWVGVWFNARQQQAEGNRELDRRLETPRGREASRGSSPSAHASSSAGSSTNSRLAQGALVGRIEIPRLNVSTIVFEGTGDNVLSIGVGHLSGTALPGEQGNVVLAAHRDTFFRPLRSVHKYDRIVVVTPAATRRYQVDSMEIVSPNYVEVLAPTPGATLTLVTCYPFEWFGHAPRRFIVRAHELDSSTPSRTPASAANVPASAEGSHPRATVDRSPAPVHPAPVQAKRVMMSTVTLSQFEPVARPAGPAPQAVETEPATLREPAEDLDVSEAPKGNRMMRGLKKLNPKRLLARITVQ